MMTKLEIEKQLARAKFEGKNAESALWSAILGLYQQLEAKGAKVGTDDDPVPSKLISKL
jgi:hypothetical protein